MTPDVMAPPEPLTAAEFAAMPNPIDGSRHELVAGKPVTLPPHGFRHALVRGTVGFVVAGHVKQTKLGRVTLGTGLITRTAPDTVRGPDVAFWSYARVPADQTPVVYANTADLVAEVVSPSNTRKQVAAKVREYFATGVRMVWVVDPDGRTVTVYTRPGDGVVLWEDATLTGGEVLPGFACPVADLFAQ
jgi:Uma2 family endonuclease